MNDYSSIKPVEGASLKEGWAYHDIPGKQGPSYRSGSLDRSRQIADHFDVNGKAGVDIGCSLGGISFGLLTLGASQMSGFDYDESAIDVARRHAAALNLRANFECIDIASEAAFDYMLKDNPDFVVWLSNWMWIAKQKSEKLAKECLRKVSRKCPVLIFETAEVEGSIAGNFGIQNADDVKDLLLANTSYSNVECIGLSVDGWHNRHIFMAKAD
jgi:hypothetical protein